MLRSDCIVCGSKRLETIVDLGMHPFADTFISEARLSEPDLVYWLACDLCLDCGQIQTKCITNPEDRYCRHDYSYTSSNSAFSRKHWKAYAAAVTEQVGLRQGAFVVEVGSNDGFLLEQFRTSGARVLGVDASPFMAHLAQEQEVDTLVGLFGPEISNQIRKEYGCADLIVANNVFNHANDVVGFAEAARELLSENGTFVFELPYWCIGLRDGRFDQIYHEHVSYFTATSARKLLDTAGLAIVHIEAVDYHGGSLRVFAKRKEYVTHSCATVDRMVEEEQKAETFAPARYREFMNSIYMQRDRFLESLYHMKCAGIPIIGVGAAAKGNTFLNFYNLDSTVIDCVTDSSKYKQGKFTPGTRIPIRGDDVFKAYDQVAALILSWNLTGTLKENLLGLNPRIQFLVP